MGDYTVALERDKYPSVVALQATEREITIKLREYKQAVRDYLQLVGAADTPDSERCPVTHPFPFFGEKAGGSGELAGPATACCASGQIATSGRWPRQHASLNGSGPAEEPGQHVGADVSPGSNDIYNEPGQPEACKTRCSQMPGCKAVVARGGTCFYKSVTGPLVTSPGSTSYVIKDPRQCGGAGGGAHRSEARVFGGTNIASAPALRTLPTADPAKCNLACTNDPKCVAFSVDAHAGSCTLKEDAGPMVSAKKADPLIDSGTDPTTWGGTCQGMVDRFGYAGPGSPGCAPKAAIDWFNAHGCKICIASCNDVRCGGCARGCWGGDTSSVHYGGCASRNQCNCNYDGSKSPGDCGYVICGKEGRMISAPSGAIAWVDHDGNKHVYSQEAWKSKSLSCGKVASRDGIQKVSQGEWDATPTGQPMANREECADGERKLVRPKPDADLLGCGNPFAGAVNQVEAMAEAGGTGAWNTVCSELADKFGMRGDQAGCAQKVDDPSAKKARDLWSAWGCAGHGVVPKDPLTYAGCDAHRHVDRVDSYVLTSPKPCFNGKGELEGLPDWCKTDSKDPGCLSPPCQPTGSLCPKSHPFPFTKNGVEDAGCCDTAGLGSTPGGSPAVMKPDDLPELMDPIALDSRGIPIPAGPPGEFEKLDPETGRFEKKQYARKPARKPPQPLPGLAEAAPPHLGPILPVPSQKAPLLEGFAAMGQNQCQGTSVDCPVPPCRSGEGVVARERAWRKVSKLNAELIKLVKSAETQQQRAFAKGVENVSETRDNTRKLREVQQELKKEHQKVSRAKQDLDRVSVEYAAEGDPVPTMEWWRFVMYGLVFAVVLAVVIRVAVSGTVGTAEVVVGIAGVLLLAHHVWGALSGIWTDFMAQGRASGGFL